MKTLSNLIVLFTWLMSNLVYATNTTTFSEMSSFMAGRWHCQGQSEAGPWGPKTKFEVEIETRVELDGHLLRTTGTQKSIDDPYRLVSFSGISAFDVASNQIIRVQADSLGGLVQFRSSGWKDGQIVFEGSGSSAVGIVRMRHTIRRDGRNTMSHAMDIASYGEPFTPIGGDRCHRVDR